MQLYQTKAIVLQVMDFRDYDQIATLFSADSGVIRVIVKNATRFRKNAMPLSPLLNVDVVYGQGRSDLLKCQEISVLHAYLKLRQSLESLQAAFAIVQTLLTSQIDHAPAPLLYELTIGYFDKIPEMRDPFTLAASFHLKILRHDGLLALGTVCAHCGNSMESPCISAGETFCFSHAPSHHQRFTPEEMTILTKLAYFRQFAEVAQLKLNHGLRDKIKSLFVQQMELA